MNIIKTRTIDCTHRYWDGLTVTIDEFADGSVKVRYPTSKHDGLGGEYPAYHTQVETGAIAELIKKLDDNCCITAKSDGNKFKLNDILAALPLAYGYAVSDF